MVKGIRYCGAVADVSGYGEAARNYILLLHKAGIPIRVQPASFEKQRPDLGATGELLRSMMSARIDYDTNIIHLTPEHYSLPFFKEVGKRVIGYFAWETDRLPRRWVPQLSHLDVIFVPCQWNKKVVAKETDKPIYVIPHGIDIDAYKEAEPLQLDGVPDNVFKFYSIFQFIERKNPLALLVAYWTEFAGQGDVVLILKTYMANHEPDQVGHLKQAIASVKSRILLDNKAFPKVVLVSSLLSTAQIRSLHALGDVFVLPTRGEGFCLPMLEALAAGKPSIVPDFGGHLDFTTQQNSWLVESRLMPVIGMQNMSNGLYTADQNWADPSIMALRAAMREAYENRELLQRKAEQAKVDRDKLSWDAVGKIYLEALEEVSQ